MSPSLTSAIIAVKPHIDATVHLIYQKAFSAKDRIAFYDMRKRPMEDVCQITANPAMIVS